MRPNVARMMSRPLPPRKPRAAQAVRVPLARPTPLMGAPCASPHVMREALFVAKDCLEKEIAWLGELLEQGSSSWYAAAERMFDALDAICDALGEARPPR